MAFLLSEMVLTSAVAISARTISCAFLASERQESMVAGQFMKVSLN